MLRFWGKDGRETYLAQTTFLGGGNVFELFRGRLGLVAVVVIDDYGVGAVGYFALLR